MGRQVFLACLSLCLWADVSGNRDLDAYLQQRSEFLHREDALMERSAEPLTEAEKLFDKWLTATVDAMVKQYKKERLVDRFVPATYFPKVRAHIENTTLYKVLRKMPKGGALHLHFSSATSLKWIVDDGLKLPGCFVYWPTGPSLKAAPAKPLKGSLAFFNATQAVPEHYIPGAQFMKQPGFQEELLKMITIHEEDVKLTSPQIWAKFADIFVRLGDFFTNTAATQQYLRATIADFLADGVSHMEFRIDFFHDIGLKDLEGREYQGAEKLDVYGRVVADMQKEAPQMTAKMIASSVRFKPADEIAKDLAMALEAKRQRPDVLVGWDAPGEEDTGRPTLDYAAQLLKVQNISKSSGVELPLMLHDGESDWSTLNVVDAVLLGTKRLGHGFNILSHPLLMEEVRKRGVAIEVCPISNQVLRYLDDLRIHPGARMIENGLPVVLSSDDPGIWGASGLTHDFWEATVAWQLNTRTLKALARNSLELSGLAGEEKKRALANWQKEWQNFIAGFQASLADTQLLV